MIVYCNKEWINKKFSIVKFNCFKFAKDILDRYLMLEGEEEK